MGRGAPTKRILGVQLGLPDHQTLPRGFYDGLSHFLHPALVQQLTNLGGA